MDVITAAANWPLARLVEIWNSLPGAEKVKKFKDRATAMERIWKAIQSLSAAPTEADHVVAEPATSAPEAPQTPDVAPEVAPEDHPSQESAQSRQESQGLPRGFEDRPGPGVAEAAGRRDLDGTDGGGGLAAAFGAGLPERHGGQEAGADRRIREG
jgi:hypothetical protein